MPQLPRPVVRERAARLREACARRRTAWLKSLYGTEQKVLVESEDGSGHAENFAPVRLAAPAAIGSIVKARIEGHDGQALTGAEA